MKTHYWFLAGIVLSTHLLAQAPSNSVRSDLPAPTRGGTNVALPPISPLSKETLAKIEKMKPIFDGKTLDGWIQSPPYATSFSREDISDVVTLAKKMIEKPDSISTFISEQLDEAAKTNLAAFSATSTNLRPLGSALARNLTRIGSGASIYDESRFGKVQLRPETIELRKKNPQGEELARLNRLLLEDAFPDAIAKSPASSWTVKDGAMASLGAGRGVIYTKDEYKNYRVIFTMRHLGGPPGDHAPCVLVFCTMPPPGEKGRDALGGIQFQPPNGGSWDYRPGKNNDGRGLFKRLIRPGYSQKEWHQVELLVNADKGTARMAVAQPVGTKAVEVLQFNDPTAGKAGPLAWQMHNKGLFDEFKDVRIEVDPAEDKLITTE